MRRSLTLVSTWVVATGAAVGLAWAGVGLVADRVAEPVRPVPTVAARPSPEPAAATSPSPTASPIPSHELTVPSTTDAPSGDDGRESGGAADPRSAGHASEDRSPGPSIEPSASHEEPEDDGHPEADVEDEEERSDGDESAADTRAYRLVGGTVTISFSASRVEVVIPATPAEGFGVSIERESATDLRIEFTSEDHESRLDVWWDRGPRDEIREESDD